MAREKTERLLEMVEEGLVSCEYALTACLKYMSEDAVADMMRLNDLDELEETE